MNYAAVALKNNEDKSNNPILLKEMKIMLSNFEAWKVDQVRCLKMLGGRIMPIASLISSNQTGTKYSQYFRIL
jgi:hypothetical protein